MNSAPSALVLGYGSTLRGDDRAGRVAAERLAQEGYTALSLPQLAPELAERIAAVERVVFLDVSVTVAPGAVEVTRIEPAPPGQPLEHQASPRVLLELARTCYGWSGQAWLVGMGVESFDLSEELTPAAATAVERAVSAARGLVG